jgi:predicted XRE-type DNA-binding protein
MIMTEYTISSGNIFEDLGFANAEEKLAKVKLASMIYDLITEQELSEQEVSQILGIDEAKISNLKNGRLQKFSLEQMFDFLVALGQKIEILVTPQALANSSLSIQVMYRNQS